MSLVEGDVVVRAEARVGSVLRGKYRLERVLGVGGMAAVYEATHRNSKRFAVKVLHAELSLQADVRARFLREGYAATQVKHPGAVAVLDDDVSEDGAAFLVMELLEGESVDALWEKHRWKLPPAAVLAIAHQLLDVLAAAHAGGVIHRDIKPENLFLTTEGYVKVLDFGIARLKDVANSTLTGAGFVMGTPSFMAPEQALGKSREIDAQSDLWAAGAVLFTLLSGHYVHEGENSQETVVQCATEPARSLAEVLPDAPRDLVHLVDSALAFKKASRWSTAVAMRKGVEAAALAILGGGPSRGVLLELLSAQPAPAAPPGAGADPITNRVRRARVGTAEADVAPEGEASAGTRDPVSVPPPRIGQTTDQPVARDPRIARRSRRKVMWGGAAAGIALAVLAFVGLRGHSTEGPSPPIVAAAPPPAAQEPSAPPAAATAADPVPLDPADLPVVAPTTKPAVAPPPRPQPPQHATTSAPAPAPATPPAAAATPGQPNCTPPFTIDPVTGKKKWKAECL